MSSALLGRLRNPRGVSASADQPLHAGYGFLKQQNLKGRQEKGRGGLTQGLSQSRYSARSFFTGG
jgi:hypothetical protein